MIRFVPGFFLALAPPVDAERGLAGERLAALALRRSGFSVLLRRFQTPFAEIDLVCREGHEWVLVEVKTGNFGERFRPGQRCDRARLTRLRRAAKLFSSQTGAPARVDLLEVLLEKPGFYPRILHHRALQAPIGSLLT